MSTTTQKPADRWRHQKLAAIPILALVLAGMLYRNFAGGSDAPPFAPPPPRLMRVPLHGATAVVPNLISKLDAKQWPKIELEEIIARNPFGTWNSTDVNSAVASSSSTSAQKIGSPSADSREPTNQIKLTETVTTEKVQALYRDAAGAAAIVDSHVIRPGDALEGGFKVIEVTNDGITVKKP